MPNVAPSGDEVSTKDHSNASAINEKTNEDVDNEHDKQVVGLLAVLCACFSSGFAGVFFEMLVKTGAQPSVVIRNLQLGMFSLVFGAFAVIYNDFDAVARDGFFQGYNYLVVIIIILQVSDWLLFFEMLFITCQLPIPVLTKNQHEQKLRKAQWQYQSVIKSQKATWNPKYHVFYNLIITNNVLTQNQSKQKLPKALVQSLS